MRKFNLEEAKSGVKVCTRDGRKARIICFDYKGPFKTIIALVENKETGFEEIKEYFWAGQEWLTHEGDEDLMIEE